MDLFELAKNLIVAHRIAVEVERPGIKQFWLGYLAGICRHFYEKSLDNAEEHQRIANAYQGENFRGIGYRAGFGGMSILETACYLNKISTVDSYEERWNAVSEK